MSISNVSNSSLLLPLLDQSQTPSTSPANGAQAFSQSLTQSASDSSSTQSASSVSGHHGGGHHHHHAVSTASSSDTNASGSSTSPSFSDLVSALGGTSSVFNAIL